MLACGTCGSSTEFGGRLDREPPSHAPGMGNAGRLGVVKNLTHVAVHLVMFMYMYMYVHTCIAFWWFLVLNGIQTHKLQLTGLVF